VANAKQVFSMPLGKAFGTVLIWGVGLGNTQVAKWSWSCPVFTDTFQPEKESDMPTPKPPYPAAFRQQIVELARAGRSVAELAREFGCDASSIRNWVRATEPGNARAERGADAPLTSSERQELLELRRKLKQVQMERDILAKATAWFAGKSERTSTTSTNS
jgi:transposase